jgi:long-subunit fatty acid transport protein
MRFEQERTYTEYYYYSPPAQPVDSLGTFYQEKTDLITTGTGANLKIGAIYRVSNAVRVGAALHTPTFYAISEEYRFRSESEFSDGAFFEGDDVTTNYSYSLRTPMRYLGSIAFLLNQQGAINFEYEYVDYSTARLNDVSGFEYDYSAANQATREVLSGTHNIRVGAEYRIEPFVIRGGFRYEDNPFNSGELFLNPDESRKTYSLGTGFRSKNYNIDVTYMRSDMQSIDPVYTYSDAASRIDEKVHRLIFTVGWRW